MSLNMVSLIAFCVCFAMASLASSLLMKARGVLKHPNICPYHNYRDAIAIPRHGQILITSGVIERLCQYGTQ